MPKRRITCKVIKVSKTSDGTRSETLIENLFDSDSSSDDTSGRSSSHAESISDDGISVPALTLQILHDLFPNHCPSIRLDGNKELCRKCKESLDYNSSAIPCWYKSSYITGLIFKQTIFRLEAEYKEDEKYQNQFLAKFLYMLERYDKNIDPNVLFDKPDAKVELVQSLFDRLKKKDKGSMTVFQIVSNEVLANVLKVEEFSPVKAMSMDICHLIHLYTWKTVSIPNGASVSSALLRKQEKVQQLSLRESRMREETSKQIFDHFNTVKSMVFNYFLLNYQDYCDIVTWNQFSESLIAMFPTMFEFKSNKQDAWLECILYHVSRLYWYNWMRGPRTWNIRFYDLDDEQKSSHYEIRYPVDCVSSSDASFKYIEFNEPVVPKILCPKHEINCYHCNTRIPRGSCLYQWSMGTQPKHNPIIGLSFPREIQYLKRDVDEWDRDPGSLTQHKCGYFAVCSRRCYLESERSKFPRLNMFFNLMGPMLSDIKESNSIFENIEEYNVINVTNIPGDNAKKGMERIKEKMKKSVHSTLGKLMRCHRMIELEGLKDLALLEFFALTEEDLDLDTFSTPEVSWKRFFIPDCFHLTTHLNARIIYACKKIDHYLSNGLLADLDYSHVTGCQTSDIRSRLSVDMSDETNVVTLISNYKKTNFFDKACDTSKEKTTTSQYQCKHQSLKTLTLVWKKEWATLYSSSWVPCNDDFSTEVTIEACEKLEDMEMFSCDKHIQHYRQRCMKEIVNLFDLPHCCMFPINSGLIEIKDFKVGHPFVVSDNRQKQHIKSLMKLHDYLVFATNLDLKNQRCAGGILFFDEQERTRLCGIIMTGWDMFNFLMDYQKLRPFLNAYAIYQRWNFHASFIVEHEAVLENEFREHNPFTASKCINRENSARNKGIGRHKFGSLTLCLFKDTIEQREKIHKPIDILNNEHNIYSIPLNLKVQGLLNTDAKNSDDEGKFCYLENVIESFGHQPIHNPVANHTTLWPHHPHCFFGRPWICGVDNDRVFASKPTDVAKMVTASNAKRDVHCPKCSFNMQYTWEHNDRTIDSLVPVQRCPIDEGAEKEFGVAAVSRLKTIGMRIHQGLNIFRGYMMYNEPSKAIFPGNFDLYMLDFKVDPDVIVHNCTTTKPPRNGLKIIVDGETSLNDILWWGLRKFHCLIKNMDQIKILLLDTNDPNKENLIHVSGTECSWFLNELVGQHFGNPMTLFVFDKSQKKKENSVSDIDVIDFPYKSIISRPCFNDNHHTTVPHFLNWHARAFSLVQEHEKNRCMFPQPNHPLLDHKDKALRKHFKFCHEYDLIAAKCSEDNYETTKCCQEVAEVEFFKCKVVLMIKINKNHHDPRVRYLADLTGTTISNNYRRGYCLLYGPSIDQKRRRDMSREFVIANYGPDDDGIYVLIGSQGPKSTPSNGFHYGIIKYDTGTLRSKLFIPPDVNWHKNEFQEFYNVEEYLTRILKHVVKKNDMYGTLFFPPELRSENFVNFKICHVAKFRNESKPSKQGMCLFLSMQTLDESLKRSKPEYFNNINGYDTFYIWHHLNQNNLKRKFKKFHDLGSMLITPTDHMCDLIKMDNTLDAISDFQEGKDGDIVVFTSYTIYDAYMDANPFPHIFLTAKMGMKGIFFFKMLPTEYKAEMVSILKTSAKAMLSKCKGLGSKGQLSMDGIFKNLKSKDKHYHDTMTKIANDTKLKVSEAENKFLQIPITSKEDIEEAMKLAANEPGFSKYESEDQRKFREKFEGRMVERLAIDKDPGKRGEELISATREIMQSKKIEEIVDEPSENSKDKPAVSTAEDGPVARGEETKVKQTNGDHKENIVPNGTPSWVENPIAKKQKMEITKQLQKLKIDSKNSISVHSLSKSLNGRCSSCDKEFPKDKDGVLVCMKCQKSVYCNEECNDAGSSKHQEHCPEVQLENNLKLFQSLDI